MIHDVIVPTWGLTADEYVLIVWLCEVGDEVKEGEPIAELETDKADGELESPATGRVEELLAQVGDTLTPRQVIARIRVQ